MKSRILEYVADALRNPREQLSRGQHFVRHSWDLTAHCWRQLQRHRAEGMAAELTYRTIFALIPVVVLGLVMFRIFGGLDDVQHKVENQLYSFFGVPEIPDEYVQARIADDETDDGSDADIELQDDGATTVAEAETAAQGAVDDDGGGKAVEPEISDDEISEPEISEANDEAENEVDRTDGAVEAEEAGQTEPTGPPKEEVIAETRRRARASIRRTLHDVTSKVASVDFRSIGVFGLLLFVYAAVALADSTDHLFNLIYEAPSQRPIHIRVAIHWSIITLGSGLLAMSLYMSGQVVEWFGAHGAGSTARLVLSHLLSIAASWVLLFLLYALMPNTHVSVRAAAIGSLVGSLLWEAAKFGFQVYVATAVPYSAIYGSIGLIPLFLFWIYVTWLIVLFGLILTYTLQVLGGRALGRIDRRDDVLPAGDPDWMLPIMCEVGHAFNDGDALSNHQLADRLGLSSTIVRDMIDKLIEAKMLRRIAAGMGEEDSLTLARPAEKILVSDILALAHHVRPTSDHPAWKTLGNLKEAERSAAGSTTLADVQSW